MKRMHIHVGVKNIEESVRFYSALFGTEPAKLKSDYAKWMLEDPHLNFAISTRGKAIGLDHMGLQVEDAGELNGLRDQMSAANISTHSDGETTCCYAKSENPGWRTRTALPGKPTTPWKTRRFMQPAMWSTKPAASLKLRRAHAALRSRTWPPLPPAAGRLHDSHHLS
ncbi:hypothetical protein [Acidisoma cladoniae]|uniref:hypothetical protein n=1 Tax=Acidisoma cladoniae TaxID=3040935 RepID=UPI00254B402E|nr:hypothetical protein [Acidisoma sp. PAMC 29798]